MADHVHSDPAPIHPPAPEVLELRWHTTRMTRGYSGPVRLSLAYPTERFCEAWNTDGQASYDLGRLGFRYKPDVNEVAHWGTAVATDVASVEAVVREAAVRDVEARRVAQDLRDRLQHEVEKHAWAAHMDKVKAAKRVLAGSLSGVSAQAEVRKLLAEFEKGLARAKAAVARAVVALDPATVARFVDAQVRADVHEACRAMSRADADLASQRNAMGWSKSTSARGHWIAEVTDLTPDLAAVGYALVAVHVKQLRRGIPELANALFGSGAAPAPR